LNTDRQTKPLVLPFLRIEIFVRCEEMCSSPIAALNIIV